MDKCVNVLDDITLQQEYRKYSFLEEWNFTGKAPSIHDENCIFIKSELYDMFQYFLNYLRDKPIKFVLFPLELYSEVTGEPFYDEYTDRHMDGTAFMLNKTQDIWNICVPQYIKDIYDLAVLGHEIAHILLDHRVVQDKGATYQNVNYGYEYDANKWSYETLYNFGYLTLEEKLKLIEICQLDFMVDTKHITPEVYKEITSLPEFKSYNRTTNGLLSDKMVGLISNDITCNDALAMLPKMIGDGI